LVNYLVPSLDDEGVNYIGLYGNIEEKIEEKKKMYDGMAKNN
jgi:hypothetical protein